MLLERGEDHSTSPSFQSLHFQHLSPQRGRSRLPSKSPLSQPQSPRPRSVSADAVAIFNPADIKNKSFSNVSYDGISRKRPRQTTESPKESPGTTWVCHTMYDLVHLSGCSICQAYMAHVDESDRHPSFQKAIQERDRKNDAFFFDGVSEGRRRQRDDDEYAFEDRERYKAERNEALEIISRFQAESHDTREELRTVTEQLCMAQADCERLRQRVSILNSQKQDLANELQQVLKMEVHLQQLTKSDEPMLLDYGETTPQISPPQLTSTDLSSNVEEPLKPDTASLSRPTPTSPTTYASIASSPPHNPASSAIIQRISHNLPPRPPGPVPAHTPVDLRASAAQSPTSTSPISPTSARVLKNLRQLQSLMAAAHKPGNERALARIKALCGEAHATPRDQKTDLQRYLLLNWRNPTPSSSNGTSSPPAALHGPPTAPAAMLDRSRSTSNAGPGGSSGYSHAVKNNPRIDDPVEVWYEYLCMYPSCCPRGVRRDALNRPHLSDLRASRIVARLRPELSHGNNLHLAVRADFMTRVVSLFSVPGAYAEKIKADGLVVAPVAMYKTYRVNVGGTVREEDVARHFAQCGVTASVAENELEPWAMYYLSQTPVPSSST